ncbi:membrane protein [Kribbella pratensis]|uniref:Membrane protein n=1 Tax=Kribbella pratensis TaxID=2512112 RepID=A0ABY2FJY2_9ACTN|nr:YihY/virulence factor BrkB family protein [Kribbella pratensis]TDW93433.1 membrane protein [Kribbella pratensis]
MATDNRDSMRWRQRLTAAPARAGAVIGAAVQSAWGHRVLGMAAEIGFWMLLSLPPLALCLLGLVGYLGSAFGVDLGTEIEPRLIEIASQALTPATVNSLVRPLVDEVLTNGRADVASAGFLLALWAGSTATASYVNAIAIAYGQRSERGAAPSRVLALGMYLAGVVIGVVLLPLLLVGPQTLIQVLPPTGHDLAQTVLQLAYWPSLLVLSLAALVTFYHYAVPLRARWRDHLPGAAVATAIWLAGAAAVRLYLRYAFDTVNIYGPISAPIAALLFFYLTALAILLGAEANAQMRSESRR